MGSDYLSHIADDQREETVLQHLQETSAMAADFASPFDARAQGELAGLAHDLGKYSAAFQRRLRGDPRQVDHATAGAWECWKRKQLFAAFAVAGHHGKLPDGGSKTDNADQPTLCGRMRKAHKGLLEAYGHWTEELALPEKAPVPDFTQHPRDAMFFTRMLYSCLVDADFLCTERFMSGQGRSDTVQDMTALEAKLRQYTAGWFPAKTELNLLRCSILEHCQQKGEASTPGLFTLTVPTGGGKTVSSLAFALAHARAQGLERVIYVIPYTSIIEQNAQVFRDILGEDTVLEHHSGVLYDLEGEADPQTIRMAQATENWDMPVVVTTAVQFFESLFSCRSSQCRKLHHLARSVIIFDEAQMLPLPYLQPCVWAISQLVAHYHASAVLCTATQPALGPLFQKFLPGAQPLELCPGEILRDPIFQRTAFRQIGKLSWDELAEHLNQETQVLCIVNSRKGAQEIYGRLQGDGCYHLSTLMYPAHRVRVLREIRQRLRQGLPCRVVSTSLIEAGVDVDFPAVWRELAGLDSVLQAAGRCNREGKRDAAQSIVTVFQAPVAPPPLFSAAIGSARKVIGQFPDIASPEAVQAYFCDLLELKGQEAQDQYAIMRIMEREFFPFRKIAEKFHLIDSPTRTIYIPLEEGAELVERLRAGECNRNLFRKLGKYSVAVYHPQFMNLCDAGAVELLEDGSAILLDTTLYDSAQGLARQADSADGIFI